MRNICSTFSISILAKSILKVDEPKSSLSSLNYSPKRIKISFNTRPNPQDLGVDKGPAPHLLASEGLGNHQLVGFAHNQFVSEYSARGAKWVRTVLRIQST